MPSEVRGFGYLLITTTTWGLNWSVMKFVLQQLPPFSMRAVSGALGAAVTFAVAARLGEKIAPPRGQWPILLLSTFLNFTPFMAFALLALEWLDATEAVIIAYTLPLWAALIAWPVLGEPLTPRRLVALALGLGGVIVLMGGSLQADWHKLPGIFFAFCCAWSFALGIVLTKRTPVAMPPVAAVAWQIGLGTAPLAGLALFEHPVWGRVTPLGWAALIYMGIVPLTIAYISWFRALRLLPASTAAIGTLLVPLFGVLSAAVLLGEPLGPRQMLALALTVGGVGLATRG